MFLLAILFGGAFVYGEKRHRAWQKAKEQAQKQKSKLNQNQSTFNTFADQDN